MLKPYWEEKCWGRVLHVFANEHAAVSCLEVEKGFRCSQHFHEERANLFAVQSGHVVIEMWSTVCRHEPALEIHTDSYPQYVVKTCKRKLSLLEPGATLCVPSGMWHRFSVLESGQMTEVYWPDRGGKVDIEDIQRFEVGGEFDLEALIEAIEK